MDTTRLRCRQPDTNTNSSTGKLLPQTLYCFPDNWSTLQTTPSRVPSIRIQIITFLLEVSDALHISTRTTKHIHEHVHKQVYLECLKTCAYTNVVSETKCPTAL